VDVEARGGRHWVASRRRTKLVVTWIWSQAH